MWADALAEAVARQDLGPLHALAARCGPGGADAAVSALWIAADAQASPLAKRFLTVLLIEPLRGQVADVLLAHYWTVPDLDFETRTNLLSAASRRIAEGSLADFHGRRLIRFLESCARSPWPSARLHAAEVALEAADDAKLLRRAGAPACERLKRALEEAAEAELAPEEWEHLQEALMSPSIPARPTPSLVALNLAVDTCEQCGLAGASLTQARRLRLLDTLERVASRTQAHALAIHDLPGDAADSIFACVKALLRLIAWEMGLDREPKWSLGPAASRTRLTHVRGDIAPTALRRIGLIMRTGRDPSQVASELETWRMPRQGQLLLDIFDQLPALPAPVEVIVVGPESNELPLVVGLERTLATADHRSLLGALRPRLARRPEVYAAEIPQADRIEGVMEVMDALAARGSVDLDDLSAVHVDRQLAYYLHAARVIGMVDESSQLTDAARDWARWSTTKRKQQMALGFERSQVAQSWCAWASEAYLGRVESATAADFLQQRAIGLAPATAHRRASTLRGWHEELMPCHPTHPAEPRRNRRAKRLR